MVVQESKSVPSNPFETIRPGSAHQVSVDPVGLTSWSVDDSVLCHSQREVEGLLQYPQFGIR